MKKSLFLLVLLMCYAYGSKAQCPAFIIDANNYIRGYLVSAEELFDLNMHKQLDFSIDGEIKDSEGIGIYATYNRTTGEVFDQNSHLILIVEPDGDIKNPANILMGNVDVNGVLRDSDNYVLMTITGIDKFHMAYFYYFFYLYYM